MIHVTDSITLEDSDITERFVRAAGPGGQNKNLEATAVELSVDIGKTALPPDVKARLIELAGRHTTTGGVLVVVSRAHRSQLKNREAARARLKALLTRAATPPRRRKATRPRKAVRAARRISKQRHSALKRFRSGRGD